MSFGRRLGPQREVWVITTGAVAAIINGADSQTTLTNAVPRPTCRSRRTTRSTDDSSSRLNVCGRRR